MRFADPQYLWLITAAPLAILLLLWGQRRRRAALRGFSGGAEFVSRFDGEVNRHRRAVKAILLFLALFALPIALARPQWGIRLEPVTRTGADLAVVIDTSLSMAAEDLVPSRLEQAKHAVQSLITRLEGDRVALVTFAGRAAVACPLTADHGAVRLFLEATTIDAAPVPGTALADALTVAMSALRNDDPEAAKAGRAIVVFTDGEDHEGKLDEVLTEIEKEGVSVFAVGSGTVRGGPIPLRDRNGNLKGYKKDRGGKVVTTRLEEALLERIARETDGRYYRATAGEIEIDEIDTVLGELAGGEFGAQVRTRYQERFQFPLLFCWVALFAESLVGDRRSDRAKRQEVS